MGKLTEHFDLSEFTHSQTATRLGLNNTPNEEQVECLIDLCHYDLEPLRVHFGLPIIISSGFRSQQLNDVTPGSSSTSQHTKGQAADITIPGIQLIDIYEWIAQHVPFDQLIYEYGQWVHVSYNKDGNRSQQLMKRSGRPYEVFNREDAIAI